MTSGTSLLPQTSGFAWLAADIALESQRRPCEAPRIADYSRTISTQFAPFPAGAWAASVKAPALSML